MKFGGNIESGKNETWETLLLSANNDFISVIILWYSRIQVGSTYSWMFPHSLEKYLKAYLLKFNSNENVKDYGHDIKQLWKGFLKVSNTMTSKPELNNAFNQIIDDISTIKTNQRYTGYIDFSSLSFFYYYIVICSFIRYLIIGKKQYRLTLYGLKYHHFFPVKYIDETDVHGKIIVEKVLHLSLEHAISITNFGELIQKDIVKQSISNTALLKKKSDCPICCSTNGKINMMEVIDFYSRIITRR